MRCTHKYKDDNQRLANLFKVNAGDLANQLFDIGTLAEVIRDGRDDIDSAEAFATAMKRVAKMRSATHLETDDLLPVLIAWLAWYCSTSGVEHDFVALLALVGPH